MKPNLIGPIPGVPWQRFRPPEPLAANSLSSSPPAPGQVYRPTATHVPIKAPWSKFLVLPSWGLSASPSPLPPPGRTGHAFPFVPRVPVGTDKARLDRHTSIVADICNALMGNGFLHLEGVSDWSLTAGGFVDSRPPNANDDASTGVHPGSAWVDSSTGNIYFNTSTASGAAVWVQVTAAPGPPGPPGTSGVNPADPFVVTGAAPDLTGQTLRAHFANYLPDNAQTAPGAGSDEFGTGSLSGVWTSVGPPTTLTAGTYKGFVLIQDASSAEVGIRESYSPGAGALSVACKLTLDTSLGGFSYAGLFLADGAGAGLATATLQNNNAGALRLRTGAAGGTNVVLGSMVPTDLLGTLYLLIQRDAGTNWTVLISTDGLLWATATTFVQAGTVARIYLIVNGQAANCTAAFDFVRTFASQTTQIGSA